MYKFYILNILVHEREIYVYSSFVICESSRIAFVYRNNCAEFALLLASGWGQMLPPNDVSEITFYRKDDGQSSECE